MYLRQQATLRRSFWRKIELEYEESIAYELEQAGIINPCADENDFMDPLHKEDYSEWRTNFKKDQEDDLYLNQLRDMTINSTESSMRKMKFTNFNPMSPRYRIQLL